MESRAGFFAYRDRCVFDLSQMGVIFEPTGRAIAPDDRLWEASKDSVIPGWCVSTRPQMRNCASGNLEIPGSMLRIAPE
jgi:hypothetical protein